MTRLIDMTGQRYGRLTVLSRAGTQGRKATWLCSCECGNTTVVQRSHLIHGNTRSCGCLKREAGSSNLRRYRQSRPAKQLVYDHPRRRVGRPNETEGYTVRIVELYNEGCSFRGIMRHIPVSIRTVKRILDANNDKLTRPHYKGGRSKRGY